MERSRLVVVGREALEPAQLAAVESAARRGATVLVVAGPPAKGIADNGGSAGQLGIALTEGEEYGGSVCNPLASATGLSDADAFLKHQVNVALPRAPAGKRLEYLVEPFAASLPLGKGRAVVCTLDPKQLPEGRPQVKALRIWNALLTWAGAERGAPGSFLQPAGPVYAPNQCEQIPPYMNW